MALLVRTPSRTFWNWSRGCPHPCLSQVPNMANPERPGPFSLVVAFQAHSMSVSFLEKYTYPPQAVLTPLYLILFSPFTMIAFPTSLARGCLLCILCVC